MVAACLLAEMIVVQHLKGVRLSAAPLAESQLTQRLLVQIIRRIGRLAWPRFDHELCGGESDSARWLPVADGADRSVSEIQVRILRGPVHGTQPARRTPMRMARLLLSLVIVTVVLLASLPIS